MHGVACNALDDIVMLSMIRKSSKTSQSACRTSYNDIRVTNTMNVLVVPFTALYADILGTFVDGKNRSTHAELNSKRHSTC